MKINQAGPSFQPLLLAWSRQRAPGVLPCSSPFTGRFLGRGNKFVLFQCSTTAVPMKGRIKSRAWEDLQLLVSLNTSYGKGPTQTLAKSNPQDDAKFQKLFLCCGLIYGSMIWDSSAWSHAQPLHLQSVPALARDYPQQVLLWGVSSAAWTYPWAFRGVTAVVRGSPQPQMLQEVPALAWTYSLPQTVQVSCSSMDSSTGHSTFDSSSDWRSRMPSTAAQKEQWCPGHLPAQAHCRCCYQYVPRHSRVGWWQYGSTANSETKSSHQQALECNAQWEEQAPWQAQGLYDW